MFVGCPSALTTNETTTMPEIPARTAPGVAVGSVLEVSVGGVMGPPGR